MRKQNKQAGLSRKSSKQLPRKQQRKSSFEDATEPVETSLVDKTGNQINVIYPYRTQGGGWAFDDHEVGLHREPFVLGIPEIIDSIVGERDSIVAYISKDPIPKHTGHLIRVKGEEPGWYTLQGTKMVGWLCPATLKYFKEYPENIYFKIE